MPAPVRKSVFASILAAAAMFAALPAEARDRYSHRGGGDDAAIAIGAGIVGLALGAAIASDRSDRYYDGDYYDRRYYPRARAYYYPHNRDYDRRYYRGERYREARREWRRDERRHWRRHYRD